MTSLSRRRLLQAGAGAATASVLLQSIDRAVAITPNRRTRSIQDVEHVVVLMQENRSFDHYFGTLRGVRGFGDPHPARFASGKSVFHQPDGAGEVLPFHPDVADAGLAFLEDLDHSWNGTHAALNGGQYDKWVSVKTAATMAYLDRGDIPFHYALADAFTICDAYHCSLLGPTDPNRYYMWTGSVGGSPGNEGGGGPVIANDELGYSWTTYPERLQSAGVSWKVYQDSGVGLDGPGYWGWTSDAYIGNYGDNALLYFKQYQNAAPGSPLYAGARTGTNAQSGQDLFETLRSDVAAGTLPSVSWIVAPEAYTEHPNWPANYGAGYIAQVLDALTANPDVWSKTALFITYDENDGFFDHVVPPYAPMTAADGASTVSTEGEIYHGEVNTPGGSTGVPGPYGLGQRVPMLVVSPWSKGGYVTSEVFDHTSIIRFLEARFGVHEPNITPWRRTVCGDLTSAFDFSGASASVPSLPSTSGYAPPDRNRHPDVVMVPPAQQQLPAQEPGVRGARPLPYDLDAVVSATAAGLGVDLVNRGSRGAVFHIRTTTPAGQLTQMYTVGAGRTMRAELAATSAVGSVEIHGPNGFFRQASGLDLLAPVVSAAPSGRSGALRVSLRNPGPRAVQVTVTDGYTGTSSAIAVPARSTVDQTFPGKEGWYDLTVAAATIRLQLAGHVETGRASSSDPALAGRVAAAVGG
ncbi:phosphocholine-specific phospholipase C [Nocardioides ultimimeridianus]